jgi:hypothetical protein
MDEAQAKLRLTVELPDRQNGDVKSRQKEKMLRRQMRQERMAGYPRA